MRLTIEPTTDFELDWYSNSKLVAIDTCCRWGVIRFGMQKSFASGGRSMALEAGSASHDAFAALRLHELGHSMGLVDHMQHHAVRLFGEARAEAILSQFDAAPDVPTNALNMMLEGFGTSGFFDDPYDKRRTASNIEEALCAYFNRYDYGLYPLWVEDLNNPEARVGIELFFDMTVTVENRPLGLTDVKARFIGTLDGLHLPRGADFTQPPPKLILQENKTASRLDNAWQAQWDTSHQITGYMTCVTAITSIECDTGIIRGMQIPMPRTYDLDGIIRLPVTRKPFQVIEWAKWFAEGVSKYRLYGDNSLDTPMETHSCNRYFRPCSLIPLCTSEPDEFIEIVKEMEQADLSPSEQVMMSKAGD